MADDTNATGARGPSEFARAEQSADLTPYLKRLLGGATLSTDETTAAFEAMMTGQTTHGEIGALLALLATRVPTSDEILGAARVMRMHVDRLETSLDPSDIVDTAGTGGAPKTFNVSTAAAIVAAGAGAKVAKHGNKSRTGRGSAELLRQLGINVDADRATQVKCLEDAGVCFCFAIHHHPATKHVMPVRLALGVPTIFNLLGPLTNPALARRQVMGVYGRQFVEPIAHALAELGAIHAMVVHSDDGLDELTTTAPNTIAHVRDGAVTMERLDATDIGLARVPYEDVVARDLDHAVQIVRDVVNGTDQGAFRDMTLLTTAATLVVAGIADTLAGGVEAARKSIDSGAAQATLETWGEEAKSD
ncbi:MAG: anthranilate phosphoribosyltransferase [Planctomycetota bacterium]